MKKISISIIIYFLLFPSYAFSQKLSVGMINGVNFTKPNGYLTIGKWEVKNSPMIGAFFSFHLTKSISLQTEFNYTVLNYSHKDYYNYTYLDFSSYSSLLSPFYANGDKEYEFSFYRIPLYLKLSTPTKLRLELTMGAYISFRDNFKVPFYQYYPQIYDKTLSQYPAYSSMAIFPYRTNYTPPRHDVGYFYSVGLSYPIAEKFNILLSGRYFSGRRTFIEPIGGKNGVAELTLGVEYSGFFYGKNKNKKTEFIQDSTENQLTITVKSGITSSKNSGNDNSIYCNSSGFSSGLAFIYQLSKNFAVQSELMFERKGYKLQGESDLFFKHSSGIMYSIDNKVNLDYIVIPFLFNFQFGKKITWYFDAGFYTAMLMSARCTGVAYSVSKNEASYRYNKTIVYDNIDGYFKSSDWGWAFGSGIQYPILKKYKLDLEFRYNKGYTNIYTNKNDSNDETVIKIESFALTLGLQIPIN